MEPGFRVGEWQVQPELGTLTRGEEQVQLEPKVMEVLLYLARHHGDVLPKEKIIRAVWAEAFVTDEVLTNAISELRKAFGDDAKNPTFIQTLPRRGYRLIATVSSPAVVPESDAIATIPVPSIRLWANRVTAPVAVSLLLAAALFLWWNWRSSAQESIDSIAVLPFVNAGGDAEAEFLSEGIPGSISSSLSRLPRLRVKPTSVLLRYAGSEVDPQTVSKEQGVTAVLIGRFERHRDALVVGVELIDGRNSSLIWGQRYVRGWSDILAVEEDISRMVAQALRLQLTPEELGPLSTTGTKNPEAYQAYLEGLYHHVRDEEAEAVSCLERSVNMDPDYQAAWATLGWSYFKIASRQDSQTAYSRARAAWEKLVQANASTALAHWCQAWLLWSYEKDWRGAEREFERAKELDPGLEDGRWFYEGFLDWMGRREERLDLIEQMLERADPLSAYQRLMAGYAFLFNREYDRAIELARNALAVEPEYWEAYAVLSSGYNEKGMSTEAFNALLEGRRLRYRDEEESAELQRVFEAEGMQGVNRWRFDHSEDARLSTLALRYAGSGDRDRAFEFLENAWERPLWGYENAPSSFPWDPLRGDPRFAQLLRKLNLPEEVIAIHVKADY